jgi:hypothetical protein
MEDSLGNSITWLMDWHLKQCLNTQKHVIKVPQIDVPFICNKDHIG